MKLTDYLAKANISQTALGELLGVTQSAVSQWIDREIVPAEHCSKIEKLTNGLVMSEELNSKVDWGWYRSTAKPIQHNRRATDRAT